MKVCGIELKGNEAIIVSLEGSKEDYKITSSEIKKIKLKDSSSQSDVRSFYNEIVNFFKEINFNLIAIKARATKGKFAGGSTSFKMEGLIQNTDYDVQIIHTATTKAKLKGITIDPVPVNKYQIEALKLAISLLE